LTKLGLDEELLSKRLSEISGGQRQRLMLAVLSLLDREVWLLDEPTAALDPIAESNMYNEYDKITQNKSALFISHRLASTKFCDRILFIEQGEILESGTHDELLKQQGKYAEMFEIQREYYKEGGTEDEGTV
jgi:ATP-binding cassette subfamily B protein